MKVYNYNWNQNPFYFQKISIQFPYYGFQYFSLVRNVCYLYIYIFIYLYIYIFIYLYIYIFIYLYIYIFIYLYIYIFIYLYIYIFIYLYIYIFIYLYIYIFIYLYIYIFIYCTLPWFYRGFSNRIIEQTTSLLPWALEYDLAVFTLVSFFSTPKW